MLSHVTPDMAALARQARAKAWAGTFYSDQLASWSNSISGALSG